ncbi:unnamed protein product [Enterobius vermicularis]|uniref:COesterase domain-containing protein n=1 Tax=Enterobius vermicularis TaxID=51028 RepID=A0A0N4VIY4_ENTVE|nr:unnamed protein product [Enterobius vermicularis]
MSTGDDVIPGNNGLWDQIYALKWVQKNAHVFGGDSNNVVLMGHGSGAASASILALSPRAEGLFHRIVLMSGTALTPGMIRNSAVNATWNLDRKLHCRSFNSSELLQCFRKQLEKEIIDAVDSSNNDYEEFVPVVDGKGGIIPETAEMLITYRPKVPLMLGTTRDESALKLVILNEKNMNESGMTESAAETLVQNLTDSFSFFKNNRLITQGCMHEYIWKKVSPAFETSVLFNSILEMFSHFWYDAPASRLATYYARDVPVYLYSFDHISENLDYDRAFHGCDQIFLFEYEPRFLSKRSDRNWQLDRRLTEIFSELIVNFAKFGVPTPIASGFTFNWTSMNIKNLNYLSITDTPSMNVGFRWQGHVFWNSYARDLDDVDVGNLQKIAHLERKLGYFQVILKNFLYFFNFFFVLNKIKNFL